MSARMCGRSPNVVIHITMTDQQKQPSAARFEFEAGERIVHVSRFCRAFHALTLRKNSRCATRSAHSSLRPSCARTHLPVILITARGWDPTQNLPHLWVANPSLSGGSA
jgi:hypothetical protein